MDFIKLRYVVWCVLPALFWIVSNSIYPASSDPLSARSSALAMRGRNLYALIKDQKRLDGNTVPFESSSCYFRSLLDKMPELGDLAFDENGCLWNVASLTGLRVDTNFPILISANLNPATLKCGGKTLALGTQAGACRSLLGDRAVVVVRKSGRAQVIKANRLSVESLFENENDRLPGYVEFLTPTGKCSVPMQSQGPDVSPDYKSHDEGTKKRL